MNNFDRLNEVLCGMYNKFSKAQGGCFKPGFDEDGLLWYTVGRDDEASFRLGIRSSDAQLFFEEVYEEPWSPEHRWMSPIDEEELTGLYLGNV